MISLVSVLSLLSHRHREDKHPTAISSSTVGQKGNNVMEEKVGAYRITYDSRYPLFCVLFMVCLMCFSLTSSECRKEARAGSNGGREHGAATENS